MISNIAKLKTSTLNSLRMLDLNKNKISSFPKLSLPKLQILNLSGNKLSSLANVTHEEFPALL